MQKRKMTAGIIISITLLLIALSHIGGNMTTLHHEIRINASKHQVFDTLANLELVAEYNPNIQAAKYLSSEPMRGVGSARECSTKDGPIRERVTGFEEGKEISMELYAHNWPIELMNWTTRVAVDGEGTLVTQSLNYKMKFGLLGALLNKVVMKNKMDKTLNEVFKSMRDYIEQQ